MLGLKLIYISKTGKGSRQAYLLNINVKILSKNKLCFQGAKGVLISEISDLHSVDNISILPTEFLKQFSKLTTFAKQDI